ncbi:MAG: ATP-binding protein [Gemmataceae bacterium]
MADTPDPLSAEQIDRPACFYLGREYDLDAGRVLPDRPVMYEARHLTTHGVVVGMTGSGKTGLSISLLEEAAIDGIPAVIIDPKGDLTNLLLQFPDLDPRQFAQWLNKDDARQKNLSVEKYAEQLADRWRQGLLESGQRVERIHELSAAVDFRVYTPGSEAGLPLSILRNFAAPKGMALEDRTHKVNATVTALLGLGGITGDPVQSPEHVLLSQIILDAWDKGRDLDLLTIIQEIPKPAITTVGAYNLETFFPARDRVKFASQLNNVVASPMFAIWSRGEALDLASMIYKGGRPQHLIFSIAHLDDSQRMFFVTLLLEEMLAWTRRQTGTSNLRALLYFDEVAGYLPPGPASPPSKSPLLTLLKQARAFGVGILLATQNPIDLDYKALSNAGTWFVGKLQTRYDKARLLDGLESAAAEQGARTDRDYLERVISSLGNRVFLMHNINE